jgi:cell division septation protein DedD
MITKKYYMSFFVMLLTCSLAQQLSGAEGKPLYPVPVRDEALLPMLIYFSSSQCSSCAPFDKLFEQPEMIRKLEQHYISVRVNIDETAGKACAEIYQVNNVPAFVVADHKGVILYKSDETLSMEDIQLLMETVPMKYTDVNKSEATPVQVSSVENKAIETAITSDQHSPESETAAQATPVQTSEMTQTLPTDRDPEALISHEPEEILPQSESSSAEDKNNEMNATPKKMYVSNDRPKEKQGTVNNSSQASLRPPLKPRTYSIQLGYFSQSPNANTLLENVRSKGLTEARMQTEFHDGRSYYRILIGNCVTLSEAQALLTRVHALGLKGAVHRQ